MPFRQKFHFLPQINDDEEIYFVIRQHPVVLVTRILFWFAFVGILIFLDTAVKARVPQLSSGTAATILSLVRTIFLMQATLGVFMAWALYYLNVQVITNERIIDICQKSLLNHQTSELHLQKVEDVTTQIKGPLANLFDYGNVSVQTAGEQERFVFDAVPHPHEVAKTILDLYEKVAPASASETATPKNQ